MAVATQATEGEGWQERSRAPPECKALLGVGEKSTHVTAPARSSTSHRSGLAKPSLDPGSCQRQHFTSAGPAVRAACDSSHVACTDWVARDTAPSKLQFAIYQWQFAIYQCPSRCRRRRARARPRLLSPPTVLAAPPVRLARHAPSGGVHVLVCCARHGRIGVLLLLLLLLLLHLACFGLSLLLRMLLLSQVSAHRCADKPIPPAGRTS